MAGDALPSPLLIARLSATASPQALGAVAALFRGLRTELLELGVPIDSFQGFSDEIAALPGAYIESLGGALLLGLAPQGSGPLLELVDATTGAPVRGEPVACIALKAQPAAGAGAAEVKRLFVAPSARGHGHGRVMTLRLMAEAAQLGYASLVLDTLERLPAALRLYRSLGYTAVPQYVPNPMPDVHFLGCALSGSADAVALDDSPLPSR